MRKTSLKPEIALSRSSQINKIVVSATFTESSNLPSATKGIETNSSLIWAHLEINRELLARSCLLCVRGFENADTSDAAIFSLRISRENVRT